MPSTALMMRRDLVVGSSVLWIQGAAAGQGAALRRLRAPLCRLCTCALRRL